MTTVRLGVIEAGPPDAPLQITLINADPKDTQYDCLSYDRSKEETSAEIEVDGTPTQVPITLEAALKSFRQAHRPRTVWADLLIGSTPVDRSTQAAEMKTVFEHAETVVAWLGPEEARHAAALDMLDELANRWYGAREESSFPEYQNRATQRQLMNAHNHLKAQPIEDLKLSDTALWKTIGEIFESGYFETTQSIPEIVLAQRAVVAIGEKTVSWEDFNAALTAYLMHLPALGLPLSPTFMATHQRISRLELATLRQRNGDSLELLAMIKDARRTSTTDPREAVFSLLPIITPCERTKDTDWRPLVPTADYSKDATEVFKAASKYIFGERQDVITWSFGERAPCGRKLANLPSWAMDISTAPNLDASWTTANTSSGLRAWADPLQQKRIFVDSEDALHIQAHALDKITQLSPIFTQENCRRLCLTEMQKVPRIGRETAEQQLERIARTFCLNQGTGPQIHSAPPADLITSIQSVLAEERIMSLLNCTIEDLAQQPPNPEHMARATAHPHINMIRHLVGQSQTFEALLRKSAVGRRFFHTESGRIGMTADETPPPAAGESADATPVPNFDAALADPLANDMLVGFQRYVAQQDSRAAEMLSQAVSGRLPGQRAPGARSGDLIVAVVGGYSPYVLRAVGESGEGISLAENGKYTFVGDCYLHGAMDAEPFKESTWFRMSERFQKGIQMTDVRIV